MLLISKFNKLNNYQITNKQLIKFELKAIHNIIVIAIIIITNIIIIIHIIKLDKFRIENKLISLKQNYLLILQLLNTQFAITIKEIIITEFMLLKLLQLLYYFLQLFIIKEVINLT